MANPQGMLFSMIITCLPVITSNCFEDEIIYCANTHVCQTFFFFGQNTMFAGTCAAAGERSDK